MCCKCSLALIIFICLCGIGCYIYIAWSKNSASPAPSAELCVNVTYLVHDYGISYTVTLNNFTIYNETVSARNPPPVCIGFPYIEEYAEVCIKLYDIDATTTHLHACVRVEARMKKILIAKYELGCFNMGPPGLNSADIVHDVKMAIVNSANYVTDKAVEEWNEIKVRAYDSCSCINYNCGCCAHLIEQEIHLNSTSINLAKSAAIHKVKLEEMQSLEKSSPTNNAAAVVGIVIGVITTVALVASLVVLVMIRRKQGFMYKHVWFGSSETTHLIPTA